MPFRPEGGLRLLWHRIPRRRIGYTQPLTDPDAPSIFDVIGLGQGVGLEAVVPGDAEEGVAALDGVDSQMGARCFQRRSSALGSGTACKEQE
jgi:hypothetical protein